MSYPINQMGGGKKLPTLSNPATAAQILAGYQAINGEGVLMEGTAGQGMTNPAGAAQILNGYEAILADGSVASGTYVPYYKQYLNQICSSTRNDTTCTFTATGATIDLAACWLTDGSSIANTLQYVGLYYNGKMIKNRCGSNVLSKINSVSGQTVTAICSSNDVSSVGNSLYMHCVIISH